MADPYADAAKTPGAPEPYGRDPVTGQPLYIGNDGQIYWVPPVSNTPGAGSGGGGGLVPSGGTPVVAPPDVVQRAFGDQPGSGAGPAGSWTSITDAQGNVVFYNPTTGQTQSPGINVGDPNAITPYQQQQIDLQLQQLNQSAQQTQQQGQQFDAGQQQAADQFNAQLFTQIETSNAQIRSQQAQLAESIRQSDIADAAAREQMRFAIRQVEVATEEGNANRLQNAVQIRANIQNQIQTIGLQRQSLVSNIEQGNAAIANNAAMYNATAKANADALNEQRRQTNLQQLQSVSTEIGTLAQNPADVGKLAAFLRSGQNDAISSAIARGEDAITDESLLGLRGLLGVRDELQKGPTEAQPYLIDPTFANVPEFANDLGVAPEISDIFQPINFDASGIERGATAPAPDYSQFFTPIQQPAPVQVTPTQPVVNQQVVPQQPVPVQQPQAPQTQQQAIAAQPDIWADILSRLSPDKGGTYGLEHGGMVPPGMPVRVGDSSDGKENEELAMVDAQGNLVVMPMDKLPKAENGGIFNKANPQIGITGDSTFSNVTPLQLTGGVPFNKANPGSGAPLGLSVNGGQAFDKANPVVGVTGDSTFGAPTSGAPTAQNVAQTAQNPSLGTGQIAPVSAEVARLFLSDVQQDALRRGGFTDPTQVSPLKVSAPGTSNFLQQLSASVAGTLGYGPEPLFFEELRKLQPQGVSRGTARRTA